MKKLLYIALSVSTAFVLGACAMFQTCQKGNAEKFTVNNIYGDHMVLQRNQPIQIVGNAESGKSVNVTIDGETVCATRASARSGEKCPMRASASTTPARLARAWAG